MNCSMIDGATPPMSEAIVLDASAVSSSATAFTDVMAAKPPVDYDAVGHRGERMVEAHRFSDEIRAWLAAGGPERVAVRAVAIETVVHDLLQIVVIDLTVIVRSAGAFTTAPNGLGKVAAS